jgi:hypothetical protein
MMILRAASGDVPSSIAMDFYFFIFLESAFLTHNMYVSTKMCVKGVHPPIVGIAERNSLDGM